MENYGNSTVKVLGMFHAFLRWKDRVYKQLFYVTDCDRSPNLLSRDACYTLVFSNLATQWRGHQVHNNVWCQNHRIINDERQETVWWFQETVNFTESAERLPIDKAGHSSCVLWCFHWKREVSRDAIQIPAEGKHGNPLGMHQGKCLYIYRMLSTVKYIILRS